MVFLKGGESVQKIKRIESALPMDSRLWEIGKEIPFQHESGKHVSEIKDMSAEFENSIHVQYDIYVDGKLYQSLINMPVIVTYFD